ncbi:hypothetical protein C942_02405 [Photobacterium marinum]|uniref:Uncharacterized protein n=1 Tax=Photobacterium marinum TaxID=1056511 RepID=L8JAY1_9GAMM|nr:hypothetical protein C942_02405 [Photobacterium marinum]
MPVDIEIHHLQVGQYTNNVQILSVEQPSNIEPVLCPMCDGTVKRALPVLSLKKQSYQQRIIDLLSTVKENECINRSLKVPICILLPQVYELTEKINLKLFEEILKLIPGLSQAKDCSLFPYGRSAMLLAWEKIERLFLDESHQEILILAVDSDYRLFSQISKEWGSASEDIASESIIIASIKKSEFGLSREWASYELRTSDQAESIAMEFMFRQFKKEKALPIHQFYAPFDEAGVQVNEWMSAYPCLFPSVGKHTEIIMTTPFTGDLGACSGLYNLLHLNECYRQEKYLHNTMQLEISPRLYRAAAFYTWQEK